MIQVVVNCHFCLHCHWSRPLLSSGKSPCALHVVGYVLLLILLLVVLLIVPLIVLIVVLLVQMTFFISTLCLYVVILQPMTAMKVIN